MPGKASHLRFCVNRMKIPTHSDGHILKYVFNLSLEEMKLSKYASAENAQSGNYDREIRRMASLCQFASSLTARTGNAYACPEQVKGSTTLTSPRNIIVCPQEGASAGGAGAGPGLWSR